MKKILDQGDGGRGPLLSVIVPVYNTKPYLEKCVKSIQNQTLRKLEILLVDDGSTDGSGELCDQLAKEDARIRVLHKPNGGSSSARNLGIKEAKGAYLGFIDSDDFIEPDMYESLYQAIQQYEVKIAQISRDEIDEKGQKMPDVCTPPKEITVSSAEAFLEELLLHRGDCSFCTKLIAREVLEGKAFPEGKLNEDFFLLMQVLEEISGIVILPKQAYHVFYRIGSNTRKENKNEFSRVFMDIVDHADYVNDLVDRKYPALKKQAKRFGLFQRLDYMLHIPVSQMTGENDFYQKVKKYLRQNLGETLTNPYLSGKNKVYLLLLTVAPKSVRTLHQKAKRLDR